MFDPRLAEIDFLMAVERAEFVSVLSWLQDDRSGVQFPGRIERYGLSPQRFRDMIIDLVLHDVVAGSKRRAMQVRDVDEEAFMWERRPLTRDLIAGKSIDIHLSHAGRVRLWTLRDALLRDPDIDPFGVRSRAAWNRDLFVRLRFASVDSSRSSCST